MHKITNAIVFMMQESAHTFGAMLLKKALKTLDITALFLIVLSNLLMDLSQNHTAYDLLS